VLADELHQTKNKQKGLDAGRKGRMDLRVGWVVHGA